ncbi:hypothetical protein Syun_024443 [Stephania yunnanensis]|uniref:Urease n=1 Tax=Stephania yunnanensis TaxID=152371 RepID=A0AAP0I4C7_9MAGN
MKLTPREIEKLILHDAGYVAQKRLAQGLQLNYTEAVALIATQILEFVRDGKKTVAELMDIGKQLLGRRQVLPAVPLLLETVQVEGTFPDGTKLITIHDAIALDDGNLELALYGSFLPVPSLDKFPGTDKDYKVPGEIIISKQNSISPNIGRKAVVIIVRNIGDRPIQVGSHYHFIETNPRLVFDRKRAYGMRLNIPAGTAVRFEQSLDIGTIMMLVSLALLRGVRTDLCTDMNFDTVSHFLGTIEMFCALRNSQGQFSLYGLIFKDGVERDSKSVSLVSIGGNKVVRGGNGLVNGPVDDSSLEKVMETVQARGFGHAEEENVWEGVTGENNMATQTIPNEVYASLYGPTTKDMIRLGDTDLFAEIEKDFAVHGDECVFGGGKTIRDGMGQATGYLSSDCLDTVITNAVIIDYTGIYKGDIGIKNCLIVNIGKAGNPDVMDDVKSDMIVGVNTEVIAAEGMIVTAGAIDCHVHFISPQLAHDAIASGITTVIGGGTGPADGTRATTCTPSPIHMKFMLHSTDGIPLNVGFMGKGNTSDPDGLHEIIEAGAMGLKLHEDWGSTPAAVENCLNIAEQYDIQVSVNTDTLNESGFVENTVAAFKGRPVITYHRGNMEEVIYDAQGGSIHLLGFYERAMLNVGVSGDIAVCGEPYVLPSSISSTRPLTVNTIDEQIDMLMASHRLWKNIPEDVAFAKSRIRQEIIAAEDILHDMGAISIISSGSQAMGRIGEVITRTWQTAHKMKVQRGTLDPGRDSDNFRIKRYIAKYTINPAIANGISLHVGSIERGQRSRGGAWRGWWLSWGEACGGGGWRGPEGAGYAADEYARSRGVGACMCSDFYYWVLSVINTIAGAYSDRISF